MNVKKESIHNEEKSGSVVDLSNNKCQKKMLDYLQYGVASSDKKGHCVHLQVKTTPIQGDILESIRAKVPQNYWKSQSQVLRSVISLGCYVALKILENVDGVPQLKREFLLQEVINKANKQVRVSELLSEAVNTSHVSVSSENIDDALKKLQKVWEECRD